jgi:hypothetical protein
VTRHLDLHPGAGDALLAQRLEPTRSIAAPRMTLVLPSVPLGTIAAHRAGS